MAKLGRFIRDFVTPTLVVLLAMGMAYDHFVIKSAGDSQSFVVDGKALGRRFAGPISASLGDAWSLAADTLEQGKSVGEAQAALQTRWQDARTKAFASLVTPEFAKVLPEGAEPNTPAQRAEVVKVWRDFAAGLKGGH